MKLVKAKSSDLINFAECKVGWADVWIRFTSKPHRKVNYYGLTLISESDLENDLRIDYKCLRDVIRERKPQDQIDDWTEYIAEKKLLLRQLSEKNVVVDDIHNPYGTPNVYINQQWITKRDVNKMVDVFMKELGYRGARLKWEKPPKFIVQQISF